MDDASSSALNVHRTYWSKLFKDTRDYIWKHKKASLTVLVVVALLFGWYFGLVKFAAKFSPLGIGEFTIPALEDVPVVLLNRSVFELAKGTLDLPSVDRINYISQFYGLHTQEEQGRVHDIATDGRTLLIGGSSGSVMCTFTGVWESRARISRRDEEIKFSGTVAGYDFARGYVEMNNCKFIQ